MLKKLFKKVVILLAGCFILASCSPNSSGITVYEENDSLRMFIQNKESQILWTKSLNDKALTYDINIEHFEGFNESSVCNTIDGIKALQKFNLPVYPYLKDFERLDISELRNDQLVMVQNIAEILSKGNYDQLVDMFLFDYIFNCVFFMEDYKSAFGELPVAESEEDKIFNKYYIGTPGVGDSVTQVPLRLISDNEYVDLMISLKTKPELKIIQIDIIKWENFNEQ